MTITIPTCELTGILSDAIPFASADKEFPAINAVKVDWDGQMLHAQATDRYVIGWAQWHPDDGPAQDEQEDLFTKWGGADDPWSVLLPLDDAKDIASVFKLSAKEGWAPLTVEYLDGRLKVIRTRDTGHSAITQVVEGRTEEYPDLRKLLAEANLFEPTDGLSYDAKRIALFAKVRQRDAMRLTFTGETRLTHVSIGERFSGAIMPVREKDEESGEPTGVES